MQVVQQQPTFPGGNGALMRFISSNIRYPAAARRANVQGMVFMKFVVAKDGQVQDVSILKGIGFGCDDEALRIMNAMPKWNPGKHKGKFVAVKYNLPIRFKLATKSDVSATLHNGPPMRIEMQGNFDEISPDKQPLYILDGEEIKLDGLNLLNPNDIEMMNVLKGESTAPYGEKGKNGVILITTKQKAVGTKKE